jgi:hypothetical protein
MRPPLEPHAAVKSTPIIAATGSSKRLTHIDEARVFISGKLLFYF